MTVSAGAAAIAAAVEAVTSDAHVEDAMLVGAYLESDDNPTAVGAGSYGAWQFQNGEAPAEGTVADYDNPAWEAAAIEPRYAAAVAAVPAGLWQSDPEEASEEAAYGAERPAVDYYQGQGTAAVNAAWAAAEAQETDAAATAAATSPDGTAGDATGVLTSVSSVIGSVLDPEASIVKIGVELLAVAAAVGLVIVGAVKTVSPATKLTGAAKQAATTAAMA